MATISIARPDSFHSAPGLFDVVMALESFAARLQWYFVELEAGAFRVGNGADSSPQGWITDICDEIERRQSGFPMAWEIVKSLARAIGAEDMALLIATKPGFPAPSWPLNIASPQFEIAIQNGDAYSWNVTTRNEGVIAQLQERFHNLQFVG